MWFFKREKKRPPLFGNSIEPDCRYCHYYDTDGEVCALGKDLQPENCKSFHYNPLLREPKRPPILKKDRFSKEDFQL